MSEAEPQRSRPETHKSVRIGAEKVGQSSARVGEIEDAAAMPDGLGVEDEQEQPGAETHSERDG